MSTTALADIWRGMRTTGLWIAYCMVLCGFIWGIQVGNAQPQSGQPADSSGGTDFGAMALEPWTQGSLGPPTTVFVLEGTLEGTRLAHQTLVEHLMFVKRALVQAQAAVDNSALLVEMHRMRCEAQQASKFWWESADQC